MQTTQEDANSRHKLAQLWHVISDDTLKNRSYADSLKRVVDEVLVDIENINYKVTIDPEEQFDKIHLKNCTALHFICCLQKIDIFNDLLERGADFTVKNENNQTVLHLAITKYPAVFCDIPFIDSVLSAQVKRQIFANPRDNDRISHFHGACIANHVEALRLFLDNGSSVDEVVNLDAPIFAGYTPLHFAAKFHSFEVAQILVERGANANAQTAEGLTAIDLLMEYRLDDMNFKSGLPSAVKYIGFAEACPKESFSKNEKIIKFLLDKQCFSNVGWSPFYIACTLSDLSIAKNLLNRADDNSSLLAMKASFGTHYTALHFAAINSIEAVKMLLTHGAQLEIEDANGVTPFDICSDNYTVQEMYDILSCAKVWNGIRLSDDRTSLLDFLSATSDLDQFQEFLQNNGQDLVVPSDSPLLAGSSVLHLSVIFSTCKYFKEGDRGKGRYDESIVKECLANGLDVNALNAKRQTPIHLAFIHGKKNILKLLLQRLDESDEIANLADEDNLSYLHIACAMKHGSVAEKLLRNCEVNIVYRGKRTLKHVVPGSTPLHVVAASKADDIAELLLVHNADLHATDSNGMAPIHCLLQHPYPSFRRLTHFHPKARATSDLLFDCLLEDPQDIVVAAVGLSYLHVAAYFGNEEAVVTLLELGSDVNAAIDCERRIEPNYLSRYSSCTPLYLTTRMRLDESVIQLLLSHGADAFARISPYQYVRSSNVPVLLEKKRITRCFMSVLRYKSDLQRDMEERLGLTRLHVACYLKDEEAVERLLESELNVNSQVHANSVVFAGCTPLHMLTTVSILPRAFGEEDDEESYDIIETIKLLLSCGADVTLANAEKNTPIHVFHEYQDYFANDDQCRNVLLNGQSDFRVNPANAEGLSHFHLACQWQQVDVVEKFLQHGSVDVNQSIDCFAKNDAGCSPLHLILNSPMPTREYWTKLTQMVDLLLENGADATAKDVRGNTPLHQPNVLKSPEMNLLDKLVRHGANVRSKNFRGETFFDGWMLSYEIDYARVLEKYDYPINSWNSRTGEGYIAKVFLSEERDVTKNSDFQKIINFPNVREADELGRTVIHNACSIHMASPMSSRDNVRIRNNVYAIEYFIKQGIDIDYQDNTGQTALHYAARMENEAGVVALLKCGADVNIVDNIGRSAFSYDMEHSKKELNVTFCHMRAVTGVLNLHVKKLQHLKLEVSLQNENLLSVLKMLVVDGIRLDRFYNPLREYDEQKIIFDEDSPEIFQSFFFQVEMAKTMDVVSGSLTLFDFLNGTGVVTLYPYMSVSERVVIDDFFNSDAYKGFHELIGVIKLQFRKMKSRLVLIDPALTSLRTLLGFSVPGLCEEIARFLTNSDLKSIIASTALKTRKRMRSETQPSVVCLSSKN